MALRRVLDVDEVQARVDEGRHVSLQKIQDDLAGGGGLEIVVADRRGGIHDYDREAGARELDCDLFGLELGTLVSSLHIF